MIKKLYTCYKTNQKLLNKSVKAFLIFFSVLIFTQVTLEAKNLFESPDFLQQLENDINKGKTLREITLDVRIGFPTSNVLELIDSSKEINPDEPLLGQNLSAKELQEALLEFNKKKWAFSWSIVLVGMIVIFSSLMITGLFVSRIKNINLENVRILLNKQEKAKKEEVQENDYHTSPNAIIAVICALNANIQDAERQNKLELTWSREPVSLWKSSIKVTLPNSVYFLKKRR